MSDTRPSVRCRGFNLVELLVSLAILTSLLALLTPRALRLSAGLRVSLAAAEVQAALHGARMLAIRLRSDVAVRFVISSDRARYAMYRDGNGDGVTTRDIESGVDPQAGPFRDLRQLGSHVRFGFPSGPPPVDPSDPTRVLDRLDDPIRLNRSDLASFSPLGGSTPGSLYLTDGVQHLVVVRILGISGKLKTLRYDRLTREWG